MFTGLIEQVGKISDQSKSKQASLWIQSSWTDLVLGESISVDGACLTVAEIENTCFRVDLSPETLRLTRATNYEESDEVNLERALCLKDRLAGHFVTGHIDQTVTLIEKNTQDEAIEMCFGGVKDEYRAYVLKKGCVAINGVSLTINTEEENGFKVMVIPHTLVNTNLDGLKTGSLVNIEYDWLSKVVVKQLQLQG